MGLKIVRTNQELRKLLDQSDQKIRLVPTMGALHEGHGSLIRQAANDGGLVVASIFVNPRQFDQSSDFESYPVSLEKDFELLEQRGCDIAYVPTESEIYGAAQIDPFNLGPIATVMEGAHRSGHFDGVAQVINRLFKIVLPNVAYFGEKDFQQVAVIRKLVSDWNMDIEIVPCNIVREPSGLAMSSRNRRLDSAQLKSATGLSKALKHIQQHNWAMDLDLTLSQAADILKAHGLKQEYLEVCFADDLTPYSGTDRGVQIRAFGAAWCGDVRLIDNMELSVK